MLQYKATGASGPGSTLPHRQSCPYCSAPPDEALNWRTKGRQLETNQRPTAPLKDLPRNQCIPDCMHGCHNVLHNVILACVRNILCDKGVAASEAQRMCSMGLQEGEDWDPDTKLKKSIALTLRYFEQSSFTQLLVALEAYVPNTVHLTLHVAFTDMKAMVAIVYTPKPSDTDIDRYLELANDLRQRLAYLRAPTTVWGHVWTIHTPQFLHRWRTLYPFVCHGVEGKHRVFKEDLQNSAGNQWLASGYGFAHTLVLDRIRWQLYAEGAHSCKRKQVSRKPHDLVAYRKYEEQMKNQVCVNPSNQTVFVHISSGFNENYFFVIYFLFR